MRYFYLSGSARSASPVHINLTKALAVLTLVGASSLPGCSNLPGSGFLRKSVEPPAPDLKGIQFVEVTEPVARQLLAQRHTRLFSEMLGSAEANTQRMGAGDIVEVTIWEAPPATLFSGGMMDARSALSLPRAATTLPEQMVNKEGFIKVPFAGQVPAAGRTPTEVESEIVRRLKSLANQPQVLVRLIRNLSSDVTVVGEVTSSTRIPLTPRGEKLLDALAAAGGVRQPVNKMTIQVTRGNTVNSLPLETIIRDPYQNVPLQPGDVITALFQPLSFTSLGATGKNAEIDFEAQGITLAQALARSGGLQDYRADARGVFIFRFEPQKALSWPRQPVAVTPEGMVPVIYRLNLDDPASFLVSQSFPINNKDVLYISNASLAELQKFLNLIGSIVGPAATFSILTR
jgi:polysaccharide export outer membrane protein